MFVLTNYKIFNYSKTTQWLWNCF